MKTIDLFGEEVDMPMDPPKLFDSCQICGRPLTNPISRKIGIGPECRNKQGQSSQTKLLLEDYYTGLLADLPDPRKI